MNKKNIIALLFAAMASVQSAHADMNTDAVLLQQLARVRQATARYHSYCMPWHTSTSARRGLASGLHADCFTPWRGFGPKLDREQLLLSRFVGVATELFAISAACSYAQWLLSQGKPAGEILSVADYFCRSARMRIDHHFAGTGRNVDKRGYDLVQDLLAGKHALLRDGMV